MHIVIVETGIKQSVKKCGRVLSSFCLHHIYYCPVVPKHIKMLCSELVREHTNKDVSTGRCEKLR